MMKAIENNPVVIIDLDRPRELWFGHKAMKRWSAYSGKPVSEFDPTLLTEEELGMLALFMMERDAVKNGEQLDQEKVDDLLDMIPLSVVIDKVYQAVSAAFGYKKEDDGADDNEKNAAGADGTGEKP